MRPILPTVFALIALGPASFAASILRSPGGAMKWSATQLTFKISRTVHAGEGELGVDRRDSPEAVHAAVADAIRQWAEAAGDRFSIAIELTDATTASGPDNLVTFTDPAPFDSGYCSKDFVACTLLSYDPATGELRQASIAFNPGKRHAVRGWADANDIGLVMLHEFGHALGLGHSALGQAVMAPAAELETAGLAGARYAHRQLSPDDIAALRLAYGLPPEWARLEGAVRYEGQPVPAAHVAAMTEQGVIVTSTQTGEDGSYQLPLPPGAYYLVAEPLDGPVAGPGPVFATAYWRSTGGQSRDAELIVAEPGATRAGLDFSVAAGPVANIAHVGLRINGRYAGFPRTTVGRGREYELGIGRAPASQPGVISLARFGAELIGDPFPSANNPGFYYQRLRIPADAPPGAYSVQFTTADAVALIPGGVSIVPSPEITAVEGTPARGAVITIRGTGFAVEEARSTPWMDGAPLPTQLAGATVLANGVYCELISVGPGEVVAVLPETIDAGHVTVSVLTGLLVESNAWEMAGPPAGEARLADVQLGRLAGRNSLADDRPPARSHNRR